MHIITKSVFCEKMMNAFSHFSHDFWLHIELS